MATLAHDMEEQYLKLRTKLRRVQSVHRMQALYVENKVLNALGIFGLMLDQMTVESVPDAANLAAVSVSAAQYENIFEEIGPYRINGIPQAYRQLMRLGLSLAGTNNPARAGARQRRPAPPCSRPVALERPGVRGRAALYKEGYRSRRESAAFPLRAGPHFS